MPSLPRGLRLPAAGGRAGRHAVDRLRPAGLRRDARRRRAEGRRPATSGRWPTRCCGSSASPALRDDLAARARAGGRAADVGGGRRRSSTRSSSRRPQRDLRSSPSSTTRPSTSSGCSPRSTATRPAGPGHRRRLGLERRRRAASPRATAPRSSTSPTTPASAPRTTPASSARRHDVTALLNPDVELLDDGLLRRSPSAPADGALLFPRLLNPDGSVQDTAHPRPGTRQRDPPRAAPRPARAAALPRRRPPRDDRLGDRRRARRDAPRRSGGSARSTPTRSCSTRTSTCACAPSRCELHPDVALRHVGGHSTGPDRLSARGHPPPRGRRRAPRPEGPAQRRPRAGADVPARGRPFAPGPRATGGPPGSPEGMTQFWFAASTEQFTPTEMLEQAKAAEAAGFEALAASDHFAPWWPEGKGSHAWTTLAAIGQQTTKPLGTSRHPGRPPLPPGRHRPGVHGPGGALSRPRLPRRGLGRVGQRGPARRRLAQHRRADRAPRPGPRGDPPALGRRDRDDGRRLVQPQGGQALHPRREPSPKLYVSAFGPQAAEIAAKHGDGLWTLGDPEQGPEIAEAYRSRRRQGRDHLPGRLLARHRRAGRRSTARRCGRPRSCPRSTRRRSPTPRTCSRRAEEQVSDEEFAKEGFLIGADPEEHVGAPARDGGGRRDRRLPAVHRRRPARLDRAATASTSSPRCEVRACNDAATTAVR